MSERPKLVLATRNVHKVEEMRALLGGLDVEVMSAADFPELGDVEENSETLEGNAVKKAYEVSMATGLPALADDTGLEVDALDGAPGVLSARYAGDDATYDDNNRRLLDELSGVEAGERGAVFRCVIALALGGDVETVEGRTEGTIATAPRGDGGFGYDPLFVPEGGALSYAEMSPEEKNAISHRGRAMRAAREMVAALIAGGPAPGAD